MDFVKLIISIVVCFAAAFIGSLFTTPAISTWYALLNKPPFTPPNWLFAPAWTILYLLMAVAAYLVWMKGLGKKEVRIALGVFFVQLVLNGLWSALFFGLRSPLLGAIGIVALWAAIFLTIIYFFRVSKTAGWLLVPYVLWVSFAATLNFSVLILNPIR